MALIPPPCSSLSQDILELIFKQLSFIGLLTCHDVCVSWRSVVRNLLLGRSNHATEPYRIGFPRTCNGRNFMSSCRGWILSSEINTEDEFSHHDLQLFNPSTLAIVKLPQPPMDFSKSPFKFIISTSPAEPNCKILLLDKNMKRPASCTLGSDAWKLLVEYTNCSIDDIIYYRNRLRVLYASEEPEDVTTNYSPRTIRRYLVESSSGDLLRVTRYMEWSTNLGPEKSDHYETKWFEVHKGHRLITKNWDKQRSLGDQALFLQLCDSRCVSVSDLQGSYKPNCIYFVDDSMEGYYTSRGEDCGVFDMESNTIEYFDHSLPFNRWFMPENN